MPDSHSVKGAIFAALRALSDLTHSSAYPLALPYGSPTARRLRVEKTIKKPLTAALVETPSGVVHE